MSVPFFVCLRVSLSLFICLFVTSARFPKAKHVDKKKETETLNVFNEE